MHDAVCKFSICKNGSVLFACIPLVGKDNGTFPRWLGEDGLLMEKIEGRPNWEGINLYTDRVKQILGFIRDDWERAQRGSPCDVLPVSV